MVEFLRTFENRGIKIARFYSILITKSINLQLFILILYGVGSVAIKDDLQCFVIYREVYGPVKPSIFYQQYQICLNKLLMLVVCDALCDLDSKNCDDCAAPAPAVVCCWSADAAVPEGPDSTTTLACSAAANTPPAPPPPTTVPYRSPAWLLLVTLLPAAPPLTPEVLMFPLTEAGAADWVPAVEALLRIALDAMAEEMLLAALPAAD